MVDGGPQLTHDIVRGAPDLARHFLYHAVRSAPSRDSILSLAPLAATLDSIAGGHVLGDWLAKSAARDFIKRAPLAATYAKLVASADALDGKRASGYLDSLRAAGETDMLIGAIALVDATASDADEYVRLARASGDPWLITLADRASASDSLSRGDYARAEETLRGAASRCGYMHLDWQCAQVELELTGLLVHQGRTTDAASAGLTGLRRARKSAYFLEGSFLFRLGDIARLEGDVPLLRAYAREAELDAHDRCRIQRAAHEIVAAADIEARTQAPRSPSSRTDRAAPRP